MYYFISYHWLFERSIRVFLISVQVAIGYLSVKGLLNIIVEDANVKVKMLLRRIIKLSDLIKK